MEVLVFTLLIGAGVWSTLVKYAKTRDHYANLRLQDERERERDRHEEMMQRLQDMQDRAQWAAREAAFERDYIGDEFDHEFLERTR